MTLAGGAFSTTWTDYYISDGSLDTTDVEFSGNIVKESDTTDVLGQITATIQVSGDNGYIDFGPCGVVNLAREY